MWRLNDIWLLKVNFFRSWIFFLSKDSSWVSSLSRSISIWSKQCSTAYAISFSIGSLPVINPNVLSTPPLYIKIRRCICEVFENDWCLYQYYNFLFIFLCMSYRLGVEIFLFGSAFWIFYIQVFPTEFLTLPNNTRRYVMRTDHYSMQADCLLN